MKQQLLISLLAVFALGSVSVSADTFFGDEDEGKPGQFYGGLSLGQAKAKCSYADMVDCEDNGWKLYGGYKFNQTIGVEGGYYKLFDSETFSDANEYDVKATGLGAAATASYPVGDKMELFGKGGFMAWKVEGQTNRVTTATMDGTDILLGAGASYKLNDNWGVRGEYEHVGGDLDVDMYSVGATFSTL